MTPFNFSDNPKKPKGLARQGKNARHQLLKTLCARLKERRAKRRKR